MKRLAKFLLSIFLIVPSVLGMCFISPKIALESALMTSKGGGGANSLDSPKIADNSDFEDDTTSDAKLSGDKQDENTTWTEPTYKTYDDYFVDLDITAETITEQDLTGDGSVTNPYVVHSTKGFLWLTNNEKSGISLASKYMELACDVILNDEMFDENGNPSGGDGVVYLWKPISSANDIVINGKRHSISGLYFNDASVSGAYLFSTNIASVKNLNMRNLFLKAKRYVAPIGANVTEMENCNTEGTIHATSVAGGLCLYASKSIKNCNNYVNIFASACGGFISAVVSGAFINLHIEDSVNYGNVKGANNIAGFVYYCGDSAHIKMTNCYNLGNIKSETANSFTAGGLVGVAINKARVEMFNCGSFGEIYRKYNNDTAGVLIGQCVSDSTLSISQCKMDINRDFSNNCGIVGYCGGAKDIIIQNCEYQIRNAKQMLIISSGGGCKNFIIKNLKIKLVNGSGQNYRLFWSVSANNTQLDNIILEADFDVSEAFSIAYAGKKENISISGFICKILTNLKKSFFYGTDFSGFYTDWKSGEIGLKALSGKGFFQTTLTEEMLLAKGFTKKTA